MDSDFKTVDFKHKKEEFYEMATQQRYSNIVEVMRETTEGVEELYNQREEKSGEEK